MASFLQAVNQMATKVAEKSSHLFQRVASFLQLILILKFVGRLQRFSSLSESGFIPTESGGVVEVSSRNMFSSLSESGFIPTLVKEISISLMRLGVLISFREWLHSYLMKTPSPFYGDLVSSHLFQRVASFLLDEIRSFLLRGNKGFSSLSESGFIPTS